MIILFAFLRWLKGLWASSIWYNNFSTMWFLFIFSDPDSSVSDL